MQEVIAKIREFNRFYTTVIGVVNHHILESEFSLTEVRIMFEICNNQNITAREIKNLLQIDEGYLSRTINKLVKEGIIRKTKLVADNRTYTLQLTSRGKDKFQQLDRRSSGSVAEMISNLEMREQKELVTWMDNIRACLSKNKE